MFKWICSGLKKVNISLSFQKGIWVKLRLRCEEDSSTVKDLQPIKWFKKEKKDAWEVNMKKELWLLPDLLHRRAVFSSGILPAGPG